MEALLGSSRGTIPGIQWPPLVDGPAGAMVALARQLDASQWLDAGVHRDKQFAQLACIAPWLAAHSPAFGQRLREAGIAAGELCSPESLAALPPVDRRWFQREGGVDCDAVPPLHEPLATNVTSGSTGEFLRVRRTRVNHLTWLAMVMRDHAWQQTDFSVPLAIVRAVNTGIARHPGWGPPAGLLFDTGPALTLPINLRGDELLDRLKAFGTGNLVIYPNALQVLLNAAETRGERLEELRAIRTVGEVVTPELRARAREVLGVGIADAYTSQEAGYIALQCPGSELYHLMSETLIVEVLRPDGTPCSEGETGRVVITDLHNHATPIVRYALGDLAEVGGLCPCGRGLPTLHRIAGRSRNLVRLPDGSRVWPSLGGFGPDGFLHLVPITQYQCIQTDSESVEVRLVTARPLTAAEEQIVTDRILGALEHPFRLEIRYFEDRLPLPASGKFEDFICLV